ncbi:cytochrome C [Rhizorhapis sp.]|uniref:c-type cytochrome n=1 Tax=Rhizorhapis sp. TaxID=1968842 RepID=UPI002B492B7B|nr:cytochrome C [Rhizorhapis sp.]HKR17114.1 cytochrome C [Rhizorhapis sp.]
MRISLILAAAVLVMGLAANGVAPAPNLSRNGRPARVNYMTECQGCHLPDGSGMTGKVPSLKGEISSFLTVEGGRQFLIQVPGSANSKLSDADLAELINWMITTMDKPAAGTFDPYTPEEVASYRAKRLLEVTQVRERLVSRFAAEKPVQH